MEEIWSWHGRMTSSLALLRHVVGEAAESLACTGPHMLEKM